MKLPVKKLYAGRYEITAGTTGIVAIIRKCEESNRWHGDITRGAYGDADYEEKYTGAVNTKIEAVNEDRSIIEDILQNDILND